MDRKKRLIGISADCVCDLPRSFLEEYGVELVRFYVNTETGRFRDGDEITSRNVVDYCRSGKTGLYTDEPGAEEYARFFRERLAVYDELIHITVSSKLSRSYEHAAEALAMAGIDGEQVMLVDSRTLSTGMGFLILKAAQMRDKGAKPHEIVKALEKMRDRISVSFIMKNPAQMFRNGRTSKAANRICRLFRVHPVFTVKNGRALLSRGMWGDMQRAVRRHIRSRLRKVRSRADKSMIFMTYAGLTLAETEALRKEAEKLSGIDGIVVSEASAAVTGNSGEQTIGIMFLEKEK